MSNTTYGYIRVSSKDQNEDRQRIAMREAGVEERHIFIDKQSGKDFDRPGYRRVLRKLKPDDSKHAVPLLSRINIEGSNILGDKAYGAWAIREYIDSQNAAYTIPPRSSVNDSWPVDWHTYKERHLIESFFQKLKWFRRVFTRYDKLDASFLALIHVAAIAILLK